MEFLKRLFGGGRPTAGRDNGLYVYVKPKLCPEILRVRVDIYNHLSQLDDESGYWVRKEARGVRCPFPVEITLTFDPNRRLLRQEIVNGEFVTEADYAAFVDKQAAARPKEDQTE